jgi:phage terminase large subunit
METARADGRITEAVEWYKELPVYTSWDVGAPLNQKVWIFQAVGDRINYLESLSGDRECKSPAEWAARLLGKRYTYGAHYIPHDAASEQGGLWQEALVVAGLRDVRPVPRQHWVWDGINLGLDAFTRVRFNSVHCAGGIDALDNYHSRQQNDGQSIRDEPHHDWSSHFSDAFSLSHQAISRGMLAGKAARPAGRRRQNLQTMAIR